MFKFERLDVWEKSMTLLTDIYAVIDLFPSSEKYALADQLRRAAISIPSNIAEGSGRTSVKEKIHFLEIAYGSLMETYCQLQIAQRLNYISQEQSVSMRDKIEEISKMLSGLRKTLANRL